MDPSSGLDIRLATLAAIGAGAMVLYLFALLALARVYARILRHRRIHVEDAWVDFLRSSQESYTASVTKMPRRDRHRIMRQWNLAFDRESGLAAGTAQVDARLARLRDIASDIRLVEAARAFLEAPKNRAERVSAIRCLGATRDVASWQALERVTATTDPYLSLAATEALVRIDEARVGPGLGDLLRSHDAWPEHAVARIVRSLSEGARESLVWQVMHDDHAESRARVFAALERIRHAGATTLLRKHLVSAATLQDVHRFFYAAHDEEHLLSIEKAISEARLRARTGRTGRSDPVWYRDPALLALSWVPLDRVGGAA